MKQSKSTITAIIMGISLSGLLIVQFLWVREAIKLKMQEFDRNVQHAMNQVAQQVSEKKKSALLLKEPSILINPSDSKSPKQYNIQIENSIRYEDKKPQLRSSRRTTTTIECDTLIDSLSRIIHRQIAPNNSSQANVIIIKDTLHEGLDIHTIRTLIDSQSVEFEETFRKLAVESIFTNTNIEELLNLQELEDLIRTELITQGIELMPEFAIWDGQDSLVLHSAKYELLIPDRNYETALFQESILLKPYTLQLEFKTRLNAPFLFIGGIHLSSLFFTLIVIYAFISTFRNMLKQRKLSEMKTDFINNMTHEFKTPLATINLAADSINKQNMQDQGAQVQQFTKAIKDETKRMDLDVERVLQMAQLEKHELIFQPEEIHLHALIEKLTKQFELIIAQREGSLKHALNADNDLLFVDPDQLEKVLANLFDNAIKYSISKPEIEIRSWNHNRRTYIEIRDNGIGIPKKEQKYVFKQFYRVPTGDTHDVKGFGLGLSFVKEAIEGMNGEISLESETAKGSTFTISFKQNGSTQH